ncbi:DUF4124 domain-containing protein [Chitinolyticbacter albus]|uniref:DUF4124 domain-containing protein n=1 Tax=Chitinolyticbacter albus TaxID=2961951 RepID=UPI00210996E6|nr:DUF4124 domain-containing protein [Chitinolyticbacter albus]
MIRTTFLAMLMAITPMAWATVYKCDAGSGKVEYQATPCAKAPGTKETTLKSSPAAAAPATDQRTKGRQCTGKEMSMDFANIPLAVAFNIIADFSGNRLTLSPAVTGSAAVRYTCTAWDAIASDLGARHGLVTRVENGVIDVRPR